ncbi:MAG: VWA domain-containing protein [Phycisphaerales bacterium]|nr:VWA domain-containing protein [Phycisphaerales bacterium]
MRSTFLAAALATFSLLSPALAQPPSPPQPSYDSRAENIIIPQLRAVPLIRHSQPVILSAVNADIVFADQLATTTLTMTLTNPSSQPQETEVILPVPDGATVRSFVLDGLASEGQARLLPREEARRIYESIVRAARDPALVEFVGYNLVRSSVFPVPANGAQTIRLTYEQLLTADGPRLDYVLPRSDSLARLGVNWSYTIAINAQRPISTVYSPSHELITTRTGPGAFTVKVGGPANTPGSLRLSCLMDTKGQDGLTSTVLTYPDPTAGPGGGGYFLVLAALPPDTKAKEAPSIKREVTLVIDRSGSMRGEKIEQARAAALQVVEGLNDGEFFNIVDYSDQVASFAPKPVVKNADSIRQARAYISALQAVGGTNLHDALMEALRPAPCEGCLPLVLFLTDGLPTVGQTREIDIRENAAKVNTHNRRIFSFGVGYDVNAPLLTALSTGSRGAPTFVLPSEDVEVKVGQVFRRLAGPVLASPALTEFSDQPGLQQRLTRELYPSQLPDVFEGDQIIVLGQYTGDGPRRLRLTGTTGRGQEQAYDIKFDASQASIRNAFVPRLWATRKIAFLIDEIRKLGAAQVGVPVLKDVPIVDANDARIKELRDEIVRLSTTFGILTEYTAFLATDEVDMARRDEVLRASIGGFESTRARAGAGGVSQELNTIDYRAAQTASPTQSYKVAGKEGKMEVVEVQGCQQVGDQALFRRGTRWIDARLMAKALATGQNAEPDRTVEFGSTEYFSVCNQLATEGRQGLLAQTGEVLLLLNNENVLVKAP